MEITLKSVQMILANYVLHYPEAGQNGDSLVILANDYFEDLRDENVSDELFLIAARNARKVCRFFPKIADILVEVEKIKEKQCLPPGHDWVLPDLTKTDLTPWDIVGTSLAAFTDYFRAWKKKGDHQHWKENVMAEKIIDRLRDNGFSVSGVDAYGNLTFSVTLKSKVDQLFESGMKELAGLSGEELRNRARGGYRKIVTSISDGDWKNPSKIDVERERYAF